MNDFMPFGIKGAMLTVSPQDYFSLARFSWRMKKGYPVRSGSIKGKKVTIGIQRHILGLKIGDPLLGDHRDGDVTNNTRTNLRVATSSQNAQNRRTQKDTRTGFKGVVVRGNRFLAQIRVDNKLKELGYFPSPQEAAVAYNGAALTHFGEFAKLNIIPYPPKESSPHG